MVGLMLIKVGLEYARLRHFGRIEIWTWEHLVSLGLSPDIFLAKARSLDLYDNGEGLVGLK